MKKGLIAPVREGDILLTKSSHTMNWRNGHAALVVDAKQGITLESVVLGENSCFQSVDKWRSYPNYIILRPKGDTDGSVGKKIADFAINSLLDVPYDFTVGLLKAKNQKAEEISGTQCAHLVWRAYMEQGIDIDSDAGRLITPKDIANSENLEVVQVYGMDVNAPW